MHFSSLLLVHWTIRSGTRTHCQQSSGVSFCGTRSHPLSTQLLWRFPNGQNTYGGWDCVWRHSEREARNEMQPKVFIHFLFHLLKSKGFNEFTYSPSKLLRCAWNMQSFVWTSCRFHLVSADCEEIQILPERETRRIKSWKNKMWLSPTFGLGGCSCKYDTSHRLNISVAHLSNERSISKRRPNFCAQVELLVIDNIWKDIMWTHAEWGENQHLWS